MGASPTGESRAGSCLFCFSGSPPSVQTAGGVPFAQTERRWLAPVKPYDPAEMALRGRLGGLKRATLYDGRTVTQKARDTFVASFVDGHECSLCGTIVIPGDLPEAERVRRAKATRRLHFAQLAYRSAVARRKVADDAA